MGSPDEAEIVACIPSLRRYARGLAHDAQRADDLVQDTLERAWGRFSMWQRRGAIRSWMFGIMHNLYIDRLRSQRNSPEEDAGEELPDAAALPADRLLMIGTRWAGQLQPAHDLGCATALIDRFDRGRGNPTFRSPDLAGLLGAVREWLTDHATTRTAP